MCSRRCALASANRSGGGLIGRWRHDGGSGKRGHVRPLSNGHHPPIHPTHSQPRHSPVSPTATLSTPFLFHPRPPRFISSSFFPFIPAPSIARTHLHHTGTTTNTIHYHYHYYHHAPNPYTRRTKLWHVYRYVSLCISTYMDVAYIRAMLVYPRLSRTSTVVSQNELDISRAREKSLNTRYTVYAITGAPPNFGALSERRHT